MGATVDYITAMLARQINGFPAPSWTTLALQNSWAAYGAPYATAQYQVDLFGRVWLRGFIGSGVITDGTVLLTLPIAPSFRLVTVSQGYNGTAFSPVRIDVLTNGNVTIMGASGFSGAYGVGLDQISFSTAP